MKSERDALSVGRYLRGMIWSSGGNIIGMVASLLLLALASRILSEDELGVYFLVLIVSNFACVVGGFGLRTTNVKFLSGASEQEKPKIANVLLWIRVVQVAITCLGFACAVPLLRLIWDSEVFASVVWYTTAVIAFQMLFEILSMFFVGYNRFHMFSVICGGAAIGRAVMSIVLLVLGFGLHGMLWGLIGSTGAACLIVWLLLPFKVCLSFDRRRVLEVLRFGGWIYGESVLSIATVRAGGAILASAGGPSLLAVYGNGMRVPNLMLRLFNGVQPVILSYVSSEAANRKGVLLISLRLLTGMITVFSAFLMTFARPITVVLFSSGYTDSIPVARVLSYWICISLVCYYLRLALVGQGRVRSVFFGALMQFCVMVVCHSILIPRYGVMGAAVSITIVAWIYSTVAIFMASGRDVRESLELILVVCRSQIPLLCLLLAVWLMEPSVLLGAGLGFALVASLFVTGALKISDLRLLWVKTFGHQRSGPAVETEGE